MRLSKSIGMTTVPILGRRRRAASVLAWAALGLGIAPPMSTAEVDVRPRPEARRVDVRIDGAPFTAYVWPESLTKPVLFPVRTALGTLVTRGFPLEPRAGERVDHPHQAGFWFTYGDVNGVDFWGNSKALAPEEQAKKGRIVQREIREARGGKDRGTLAVCLDWIMPDGHRVLEETTSFVFRGDTTSRTIDWTTVLTADEPVVFADTKEGMLGLRVARSLEQPSDRPEVFTDAGGHATTVPVLDNEGVTGLYHSSEGLVGDAVWGTRARWVALAGRIGKEDVVLLLLDHPGNPGYPTYWHARGYGLFAANPLGQKDFSEGKQVLRFHLDERASATFRYRLVIRSEPYSAERAEADWKAFAAE
jgi:hypothetical protein